MHIKDMDISQVKTHAKQIETKKHQKMKMRESNRAHFEDGFL